ncbi:outer membrane protein assembly factor BamA [bacterium]|nr:outer membrane protein assembly factor BamA [bacterium]
MPAGMRVTVVVLCALFLFAPRSLAEEKEIIKEVKLQGLRRANENFVRMKIRSQPGDEFAREIVDEDIKNLMATGDFRNVTVAVSKTPEGFELVYVFVENPLVREVSFSGNETISSKRLQNKVKLREKEKEREKKGGILQRISIPGAPPLVGSIYDPAEIESGVSEIRDYYEKKGYFAARVRHIPEVDPQTNEVAVDIAVEEGPRAFIRKVHIRGNETTPTKEIVGKIKTKRRKKLLPFIFGSGKLKRYVLDEDLDRVTALYHQKGFLDVAAHGARCANCGGIYRPLQGDPEHNVLPGTPFEELPDDWVCPNCGEGKGSFQQLGVELTVLPEGKTVSISSPTENLLEKLGKEWKVPPKKRSIELTITLHEGPQYLAGKTSVGGNTLFPSEELLAVCSLKEGEPFDTFAPERDRTAIYDKYGEVGYIDAIVVAEKMPTDEPHVLDVLYTVIENDQVRIGKIEITGNLITKDKVIRREIAVNPGEVFNMRKVRVSVQRLKSLNYFGDPASPAAEGVMAYDRPSDVEGVRDLVIEVKERPTGELWFGGGVSSVWDVFGTFTISQSNFDWKRWRSPWLRGAGQKARLRALVGSDRTDFTLSFTEPWLFDRPLSLGFDVFRRDRRFPTKRRSYEQKDTGFDVRLFKKIAPATRAGITYKLDRVEIDAKADASEIIKREEGEQTISSLAFEVRRDTTDRWLMPTRGMKTSAAWEVAGGFIGSDADFLKHDYGVTQYIRLYGSKHVLRLVGRVSFAQEFGDSEDVPIFERLFLGGPTTIRGFRYRMVGPKDELGEPIGGKSSLLLSAEYDYPIYGPLRGAVFYDTGNVWYDSYEIDPSDLRAGTGVGLRIVIPLMGRPIPINVDYGWPIDRDKWANKSGRFHFSMGFNF